MNVAQKLAPVTLAEFEALERDEHCQYELIDGVVMMSPSPSKEHQFVGTNLIGLLVALLKATPCRPIYEWDITIGENVYCPDVMVLCDKDTLPPEIVFEILSPSTRYRDLRIKVIKYEEAGIKEYWIIDPKVKTVTVHDYANQTAETYALGDTIQSQARPEIIIAVADIFA